MNPTLIYHERLTSRITTVLFAGLSVVFLLLFLWRRTQHGLDGLAWLHLILAGVFLFDLINFRVLLITLTARHLNLRFGIFRWEIPLRNIETAGLDEIPIVYQKGGAGIHFNTIRGRYRVSFNFLEYPRVVIRLRRKTGPVKDVSFSTQDPQSLLRHISEMRNLAPML